MTDIECESAAASSHHADQNVNATCHWMLGPHKTGVDIILDAKLTENKKLRVHHPGSTSSDVGEGEEESTVEIHIKDDALT